MGTTTREQTDYYKLVGRIDEEYYFCDYIFNAGDFKGATATVVRPVSVDEYENEEQLRDWAHEIWQMEVADGHSEQSLDEFVEGLDYEERFDTGMDSRVWDKMRELYPDENKTPVFECTGGGRSFSPDMKFDEVFDPKLWAKIQKVEAK